MDPKRFQYHNKDIPLLKKDIKARIFFMILFGIVFFSQLFMLVLNVIDKTTTLTMVIVSAVIMLTALTFSILCLVYSFKNIRAIQVIKKAGFVVTSVIFMPNIQKNSFVRLYSILTSIITIATLVVFTSVVTYSILQYVYFSTISFYLPLMVLLTVIGFNTVYHVKHEIEITQSVLNFQNSF